MENPVFLEIYEKMPQGAPGDDNSSGKAFSLLTELPENPEILDIGCGSGRHTLLLSRLSSGRITALDLLEQNLKILGDKLDKNNLRERITLVQGDMAKMPFRREQFSLVWAEGSIYILGYEKGLKKWKKFVKPDGYLVISELVWTRYDPPGELKTFWKKEYPGMLTNEKAMNIAKKEGYTVIGSLPVSGTGWDNYYTPLEARTGQMRKKYSQDRKAMALLDSIDTEIEIYKKYKDYFDYMFYILQKKDR